VDVDLIGWIGVGLGGTYGCRCGILYAHMLGVVFYVGLVSLTSSSYPSPYSSELIGGGVGGLPPMFCYVCVIGFSSDISSLITIFSINGIFIF